MQRRRNLWIAVLSILLFILPSALAAGFSIYTYQSQNYLMNPWFVPEVPYMGEPFRSSCEVASYFLRNYDMDTQFAPYSVRMSGDTVHTVYMCTDWKIAPIVKGVVRAANHVPPDAPPDPYCPHKGKCRAEFAMAKYSKQELYDFQGQIYDEVPREIKKHINDISIHPAETSHNRLRNSICLYVDQLTPEIREGIESVIPADAVEYVIGQPPWFLGS